MISEAVVDGGGKCSRERDVDDGDRIDSFEGVEGFRIVTTDVGLGKKIGVGKGGRFPPFNLNEALGIKWELETPIESSIFECTT